MSIDPIQLNTLAAAWAGYSPRAGRSAMTGDATVGRAAERGAGGVPGPSIEQGQLPGQQAMASTGAVGLRRVQVAAEVELSPAALRPYQNDSPPPPPPGMPTGRSSGQVDRFMPSTGREGSPPPRPMDYRQRSALDSYQQMQPSPRQPEVPASGVEAESNEQVQSESASAEMTPVGPSGQPLTEEQQEQVDKLKARDAEVRRHEQAHMTAAGAHSQGGPKYEYQTGPDGRRYAVGGSVQIDLSPASTPEATIAKMQQVKRAAMAPAEPSSADRQVASRAQSIENQARREMAEQAVGGESSDSAQSVSATGFAAVMAEESKERGSFSPARIAQQATLAATFNPTFGFSRVGQSLDLMG